MSDVGAVRLACDCDEVLVAGTADWGDGAEAVEGWVGVGECRCAAELDLAVTEVWAEGVCGCEYGYEVGVG